MLKTSTTDALMLLTQALHTLPAEPDPRSDFFVQWRTRTIDTVERIFADDPTLSQEFKEIEFSPRRLTRDAEKDEQLKLDACLAGCAQARSALERLVALVNQHAQALVHLTQAAASAPAPVPALKTSVFAGLCLSISQAVHYNELDDAGAVLAVSAQLLRNLSTGLADPKLRDATEKMMVRFAPIGGIKKRPDWEQADVFVWSILMALGELKRCG